MMNRSHVTSGLAVGLLVGHLVGLTTVLEIAPFAIVTAGYAMFPDLDCGGSSASRLLGPVTSGLSWGLRRASACLYRHTRGPRDKPGAGQHRHLTHTLAFCLLFAGVAEAVVVAWGMWAAVAFLAFGVLAAIDRLGTWLFVPVGVVVLAWGATAAASHAPMVDVVSANTRWVALAVGLGCVTHILGDAVTLAGVPVLFPLSIRRARWYPVGTPHWMRFRAGGDTEVRYVFPVLVVCTVLAGLVAVPGVWPHLVALVQHGGSAWAATTASG